jgi:hypothetical protein
MVAVFVLLPDERDLTKSFCCAALVCVFHGNLISGAAAAGLVLGLGSSAAVGQSWCVSLILFCRLDLFFFAAAKSVSNHGLNLVLRSILFVTVSCCRFFLSKTAFFCLPGTSQC